MITRRGLLALFASLAARPGFAQGVSSRGVRAQPRGKPSGLPFLARFTDVAAAAGLTHPVVYGGLDKKSYIVEVVGCGVAFLDYDNDGWLDLFVLNGTRLEGAPPGTTNRLYKNNRDGTFTDVTEKAGLTRTGWASAVTVGDYDNDGFDDIFITYYGQNVLYRNNGDGTFSDVTEKAGLLHAGARYGSGCTWLDYDRDGRLDLFVATYLDTTLEKLPRPGENTDCRWKGVPVNCGPRGLPPGYLQLFHNNGDGTFTDVSKQSGVAAATGSYPMTTVAADYDNDGWPDVYVACDSTPSLLFRNRRDGTFRQEALERGIALSEDGLEQAGMGVAVGDFDLDGNLDIFKTHFSDDTHVLYKNDGKGYFDDVTIRAGLGVETRYVGWGAGIADLDNDGHPDLFVTSTRGGNILFHNNGDGTFTDVTTKAGVAHVGHSQTATFFDYDNDGYPDLLVTNTAKWTLESPEPKPRYYPGVASLYDLFASPKEYNILYHNNGNGTFTDVTKQAGLAGHGWGGDVAVFDYDEDGYLDVLITNMFGQSQLYHNNRNGTFTDVTAQTLKRTSFGAIGSKVFDYNNDGKLDLLLVDMHSDMWMVQPGADPSAVEIANLKLSETTKYKGIMGPIGGPDAAEYEKKVADRFQIKYDQVIFGNTLFKNLGGGRFEEVSDQAGLETMWPWGIAVGDFDNDGHEDVFLPSGMGYPFPYWPNYLMMNKGDGTFVNRTQAEGIEPLPRGQHLDELIGGKRAARSSRCAAVADFTHTGRLDIVTNNFNDTPYYFKNQFPLRNWIGFRLAGTKSNRDAIGALVTLRIGKEVMVRQVQAAGGYLSQSSNALHFGLGDRQQVDQVEIRWPSGRRQTLERPPLNQLHPIKEPAD